jgi:hypothetical protein
MMNPSGYVPEDFQQAQIPEPNVHNSEADLEEVPPPTSIEFVLLYDNLIIIFSRLACLGPRSKMCTAIPMLYVVKRIVHATGRLA